MLQAARVLAGLILACIAAALVMVLHVIRPFELTQLPADQLLGRLAAAGELSALVATQFAMFAVPFGLIAAMIAEINRWRGVLFFVIAALAIAGGGYLLQYQSESEFRTVANPFAAQVFAAQGLAAGLLYWVIAGRFAGWRRGGGPIKAEPRPLDQPVAPIVDATEATRPPVSGAGKGARTA